MLAVGVIALAASACYAHVQAGDPGREECRTEVHNRGEVEQCHSRCHEDRCHEECKEHERQSRERKCWAE